MGLPGRGARADAHRDRPAGRGRGTASGTAPRTAWLGLLAVAAVAAAVVVGVLALRDEDPVTAAPTRSTSTPSTSPAPATTAPSRPPSTTSAPPSSTSPPTPTPTPTPSPAGAAPTADQLGRAVTSYYALLPGDLDAGWERLTERYQRTTATDRSTYGRFWGRIDRARASDVDATAPDRVTATITYDYADGRVYVERTAYRLVREDGVLKIDRSEVLSSRGG